MVACTPQSICSLRLALETIGPCAAPHTIHLFGSDSQVLHSLSGRQMQAIAACTVPGKTMLVCGTTYSENNKMDCLRAYPVQDAASTVSIHGVVSALGRLTDVQVLKDALTRCGSKQSRSLTFSHLPTLQGSSDEACSLTETLSRLMPQLHTSSPHQWRIEFHACTGSFIRYVRR